MHIMIPPNMNGQYLCLECRQPWPCSEAEEEQDQE